MTQVKDRTAKAPTVPTGSLTVITGSMFSGKTEELIRRLRRALYARPQRPGFKHSLDTRSGITEIRTHNGVPHEAAAVTTSEELLERVERTTDLVAVEEAQFFDADGRGVPAPGRHGLRGDRRGPRHGLPGEPSLRCQPFWQRPTR